MSQIYLNINNQQAGPYNIETVNQMLTSNQITAETLAWMQGMANWETVQSDTFRSLGVGAQSSSNSPSSKKYNPRHLKLSKYQIRRRKNLQMLPNLKLEELFK